MKTHKQIVGVLNIAMGGLYLGMAGVFYLISSSIVRFGNAGDALSANSSFNSFRLLFIGVCLVFSLPLIFIGGGLYTNKNWAKSFALVLAIFLFFAFPIGTALAVYTFWTLLYESK